MRRCAVSLLFSYPCRTHEHYRVPRIRKWSAGSRSPIQLSQPRNATLAVSVDSNSRLNLRLPGACSMPPIHLRVELACRLARENKAESAQEQFLKSRIVKVVDSVDRIQKWLGDGPRVLVPLLINLWVA